MPVETRFLSGCSLGTRAHPHLRASIPESEHPVQMQCSKIGGSGCTQTQATRIVRLDLVFIWRRSKQRAGEYKMQTTQQRAPTGRVRKKSSLPLSWRPRATKHEVCKLLLLLFRELCLVREIGMPVHENNGALTRQTSCQWCST